MSRKNRRDDDEEGEIAEEEEDDDLLDDDEEDDDDEDDEEEDEDDEDGGRRRRKPKRKRHRGETFLDMEAYEDSASSEEEEGPDGETDDFIDRTTETESRKSHRRFHSRITRDDEDMDFVLPYGSSHYEEDQSSQLSQRTLLPSTRDPRMWLVRCRIGAERRTLIDIMQRFLRNKVTGKRFSILSAVVCDHVPGFIYIESERETHIREALEGISTVIGVNRPKLVPIGEMTDVLKIRKEKELPKIGSFGRIKRGLYKGDLVKVVEINADETRAILHLIPRIDIQELERKYQHSINSYDQDPSSSSSSLGVGEGRIGKRGRRESEMDESKPRPEAKLFFPEKLDFGFDLKSQKFVNGFLEKSVPITSIEFKGVIPLPSELQKFSIDQEGFTALLKSTQAKKEVKLAVGDTVRVTTGDIMNLKGIVHQINNDAVIIRSTHDGLKGELLSVQRDHLAKVFAVGTPVKVVGGKFKGSAGIVASSNFNDNTVSIFGPGSRNTITVLADDLEITNSVLKDEVQLGEYKTGDLVQTFNKTIGVIIRIDSDYIHLLETNGGVSKYQLPKIESKVVSTMCRDYNNAPLLPDSQVDIHFGLYAGKSGTVRHTFNRCVFVHCPQIFENGGIILVQSSDCQRKESQRGFGGAGRGRGSQFGSNGGGGINNGPGGNRFGNGRPQPPRSYQQEKIKIASGKYKNYTGVKLGVKGGIAKIRLDATMEVIEIPIDEAEGRNFRLSGDSSFHPYSSSGSGPYGSSASSSASSGSSLYHTTNSRPQRFDSTDVYNRGSQTPARAPDSPDNRYSSFDPNSPYPDHYSASSSHSYPITPQSAKPLTPNYARTPDHSDYDSHIRSPMAAPTPMTASTPITPGMVPPTPAAYSYPPERTEDLSNVLVRINDSYRGGSFKNKTGVVRKLLSNGYYEIDLDSKEFLTDVPPSAFETILPGPRDTAKIIRLVPGFNEAYLGQTVQVIGSNNDEFIVSLQGHQTTIHSNYIARFR